MKNYPIAVPILPVPLAASVPLASAPKPRPNTSGEEV
jgi:hypothetical protein